MKDYIYLYGMVMSTEAFLLKNSFPSPDGYGEIKEKYHHIGGETGTAAYFQVTAQGRQHRCGSSCFSADVMIFFLYFSVTVRGRKTVFE